MNLPPRETQKKKSKKPVFQDHPVVKQERKRKGVQRRKKAFTSRREKKTLAQAKKGTRRPSNGGVQEPAEVKKRIVEDL